MNVTAKGGGFYQPLQANLSAGEPNNPWPNALLLIILTMCHTMIVPVFGRNGDPI